MPQVTRAQISEILEKWRDGALNASEVLAWAQKQNDEDASAEDPLTEKILKELDILQINLLTQGDAGVLGQILHDPTIGNDNEKITDALNKFYGSVDMKKRMSELEDDPFYAPYCSEIWHPDLKSHKQ